MKKIEVQMAVSSTREFTSFTLEELCVEYSEWESMSNEDKKDKIQDALNESPSQPYWMVDNFTEV